MLTGDETPVPILKREVGRLRIEIDSSSSEYKEEEEQIGIPNCMKMSPMRMGRSYPTACCPFMERITMSGITMRNRRVMFVTL